MKKKLLAVLLVGMMSAMMLTACGDKKEEAPKEEAKTEAAAPEKEEAPAEEAPAEEVADAEEVAEDGVYTLDDLAFDTGYLAKADDGSIFAIVFYHATDGSDLALLTDGNNTVLSDFTSEECESDEGIPYVAITAGNLTLGYTVNVDGEDRLFDANGNVFEAQEITESQAVEIFNMVAQ